ncbi:MAG: PEP-CTERM sorting domain-containing protein [Planctomycetota bacterium]
MYLKTLQGMVGAFCLMAVLPSKVVAIDISVEFSPGTLFHSGVDGTAKAAINAAAADISAAITSSLDAITQDVYEGSYLSTDVTFDWNYNYTNPSTGVSTSVDNVITPADTVTVFVGTRSLLGSSLGVGGPTGIGLSIGASGFPNQSPTAVNNAEFASEAALTRGGGPVIGSLDGTWNWNGFTDNYSVDYGAAYGSVAFDVDQDNNGSWDSASALDDYWHWNHATEVASGKNDLYSVALHEIMHAVGIGVSDSWDDMRNGTTWIGSEVLALTGSGVGLIQPDGGHITSNVMSTRISDGVQQEVVMDPNITTGTRKELTALDLAFLRDIGYETITPTIVYDTADYDTDGDVDGADLAILQNWYGVNAQGDADDDGDTDGSDLLVWQRQHTGPIGSLVATVPEPTTVGLATVAGSMLAMRRRRRRD